MRIREERKDFDAIEEHRTGFDQTLTKSDGEKNEERGGGPYLVTPTGPLPAIAVRGRATPGAGSPAHVRRRAGETRAAVLEGSPSRHAQARAQERNQFSN